MRPPSYCAQCGALIDRRTHNKKFCNRSCQSAYRLSHGERSPAAKKRRRRRLVARYVYGEIDRETYHYRWAQYQQHNLL
ncbi:MAG: hypothetical protein U9Q70_05685 [Chloroflexota bacterium]|nr:hypothetical protein [Chloroflexota bacterium]